MSLTILRKENVFTITGKVNVNTARGFKTHFSLLLNNLKGITIDLTKVSEVDESGLKALSELRKKALQWNKMFNIIGDDNIVMNETNVA